MTTEERTADMDLALLTQCEKAALFGKAKAIFNIQYPNTRNGGHGSSRPALASHLQRFPAWVKSVAGYSLGQREIYKHCRVWNVLGPDLLTRIAFTNLDTERHLAALVKLKTRKHREAYVTLKMASLRNKHIRQGGQGRVPGQLPIWAASLYGA